MRKTVDISDDFDFNCSEIPAKSLGKRFEGSMTENRICPLWLIKRTTVLTLTYQLSSETKISVSEIGMLSHFAIIFTEKSFRDKFKQL